MKNINTISAVFHWTQFVYPITTLQMKDLVNNTVFIYLYVDLFICIYENNYLIPIDDFSIHTKNNTIDWWIQSWTFHHYATTNEIEIVPANDHIIHWINLNWKEQPTTICELFEMLYYICSFKLVNQMKIVLISYQRNQLKTMSMCY